MSHQSCKICKRILTGEEISTNSGLCKDCQEEAKRHAETFKERFIKLGEGK